MIKLFLENSRTWWSYKLYTLKTITTQIDFSPGSLQRTPLRNHYGIGFALEISVFSQNTGKYGPEKTQNTDTFYAV